MRKQKHHAYKNCPVEVVLDLIAGKWKTVLLYTLSGRTIRFNELMRLLPSISQRVLTAQLRQLEADGLVVRTVYPEVPPRVDYALTPLGESLGPILQSMMAWSQQHVPERLSRP